MPGRDGSWTLQAHLEPHKADSHRRHKPWVEGQKWDGSETGFWFHYFFPHNFPGKKIEMVPQAPTGQWRESKGKKKKWKFEGRTAWVKTEQALAREKLCVLRVFKGIYNQSGSKETASMPKATQSNPLSLLPAVPSWIRLNQLIYTFVWQSSPTNRLLKECYYTKVWSSNRGETCAFLRRNICFYASWKVVAVMCTHPVSEQNLLLTLVVSW